MSEGFSNPIIGGGGALVYPSIHSPNFTTGVSGWNVSKDGSSEFNNLTARGQVFVGASGGPQVDIINTSIVLQIVNRAGVVPSEIASISTIDQIIELQRGTELFSAFLAVFTITYTNGETAPALIVCAPQPRAGFASSGHIYLGLSSAGSFSSGEIVGTISATDATHIQFKVFAYFDISGNLIVTNGSIVASTPPITGLSNIMPGQDTFTTAPYLSGWSGDNGGDLQYRFEADGLVELTGPFDFTSTSSGQSISTNNVFTSAIGAPYIPSVQRRIPVFLWDGTMPSLTRNANRSEHILINTDGKLYLQWISTGLSTGAGQTARFFASGRYKL